jgi:hypothetical protein
MATRAPALFLIDRLKPQLAKELIDRPSDPRGLHTSAQVAEVSRLAPLVFLAGVVGEARCNLGEREPPGQGDDLVCVLDSSGERGSHSQMDLRAVVRGH